MNGQVLNFKYVMQPFSTRLPVTTIDLIKKAAVMRSKTICELLDEIIIEHLSENDSEDGKELGLIDETQ